jgi:hypothetical protein
MSPVVVMGFEIIRRTTSYESRRITKIRSIIWNPIGARLRVAATQQPREAVR